MPNLLFRSIVVKRSCVQKFRLLLITTLLSIIIYYYFSETTSVIYFLAYGCVKNSTIADLKLLSKQSFHRHVIHLQANACYHDLCNKSMTWDVNKWLLGMAVLVVFCKLIY